MILHLYIDIFLHLYIVYDSLQIFLYFFVPDSMEMFFLSVKTRVNYK